MYATASTTGPTKRPSSPNDTSPPITPAKMRSSGRSAPFLIRIGRSTLSMLPTMIVQTRSATNQPVEPWNQSHTSAHTSTGTAPICATASMNMTAVSTAANGTPAIQRPIAAEDRLDERGEDDAEGDAADRLAGELHDAVAALAGEPPAEAPDPPAP